MGLPALAKSCRGGEGRRTRSHRKAGSPSEGFMSQLSETAGKKKGKNHEGGGPVVGTKKKRRGWGKMVEVGE